MDENTTLPVQEAPRSKKSSYLKYAAAAAAALLLDSGDSRSSSHDTAASSDRRQHHLQLNLDTSYDHQKQNPSSAANITPREKSSSTPADPIPEKEDATPVPARKRRTIAKLNAERLLGPDGLSLLRAKLTRSFKSITSSRSSSKEKLHQLCRIVQLWGHQLFPSLDFPSFLERAEKSCRERRMTLFRSAIVAEDRNTKMNTTFPGTFDLPVARSDTSLESGSLPGGMEEDDIELALQVEAERMQEKNALEAAAEEALFMADRDDDPFDDDEFERALAGATAPLASEVNQDAQIPPQAPLPVDELEAVLVAKKAQALERLEERKRVLQLEREAAREREEEARMAQMIRDSTDFMYD